MVQGQPPKLLVSLHVASFITRLFTLGLWHLGRGGVQGLFKTSQECGIPEGLCGGGVGQHVCGPGQVHLQGVQVQVGGHGGSRGGSF